MAGCKNQLIMKYHSKLLVSFSFYDHWSVAVLTVTVHSSFFPTFDFFKNMLLSALD